MEPIQDFTAARPEVGSVCGGRLGKNCRHPKVKFAWNCQPCSTHQIHDLLGLLLLLPKFGPTWQTNDTTSVEHSCCALDVLHQLRCCNDTTSSIRPPMTPNMVQSTRPHGHRCHPTCNILLLASPVNPLRNAPRFGSVLLHCSGERRKW